MSNKILGKVVISFNGEDVASVQFLTDSIEKFEKEQRQIKLFSLYYSKMLYNMNKGESSDALIEYIRKACSDIYDGKEVKQVNILTSQQKLVVEIPSNASKQYSAELQERGDGLQIIQSKMSWGGEKYYAPVSTVMFLQYLINNLSKVSLLYLVVILLGMNDFYSKIGSYSDMRSLSQAPSYGYSVANKLFEEAGL